MAEEIIVNHILRYLGVLAVTAAAFGESASGATTASFQIDHLAIYVVDLDRSVKFDHEVLGFERVPMPVKFATWLSTGRGPMLHIVGGRKEPLINNQWERFAISCEDLDIMIASLDAKKISWAGMDGKHEP